MIAAWMLYATVVTACLGLAAWVVERGLRLAGRATRLVWVVSSVLSIVVLVVAYLSTPAGPVGAGPGPARTGPASMVGGVDAWDIAVPSGWVIDVPAWWSLLDAPLVLLWVAASSTLVVLFGVVAVRVRREARLWPERELDGQRVRVAPETGPGVLGLWRPSVVMPAWAGELDVTARRMILAHEQEHVRARDVWLSHFALVVAAVLPWNVALWWQTRRLRDAIETDCDRRVLARGVSRHAYGELLVRVCERSARQRFLIAALSEPRSRLGRRIALMTASSANRFRWPAALGLGATVVALIVISCETPTPPSRLGDAALATSDTVLARIDRAPERISGPAPRYPEMLRQAGIEGRVVLSFVVLEDGTVDESSIEIVESSNRAFEGPSRQVIAQSRFEPALANGEPVAMRAFQTITFAIGGGEAERSDGADVQITGRATTVSDALLSLTQSEASEVREIHGEQPLLTIDGVVINDSPKEAMARLDLTRIVRVEVIKGEPAVERLGERARGGVIAIFTKDGLTR